MIYKARIRSHFDYCDFIYHIPELETKEKNLDSERVTDIRLNYQMEKLESLQAQAGQAITQELGKALIETNSMRN